MALIKKGVKKDGPFVSDLVVGEYKGEAQLSATGLHFGQAVKTRFSAADMGAFLKTLPAGATFSMTLWLKDLPAKPSDAPSVKPRE